MGELWLAVLETLGCVAETSSPRWASRTLFALILVVILSAAFFSLARCQGAAEHAAVAAAEPATNPLAHAH